MRFPLDERVLQIQATWPWHVQIQQDGSNHRFDPSPVHPPWLKFNAGHSFSDGLPPLTPQLTTWIKSPSLLGPYGFTAKLESLGDIRHFSISGLQRFNIFRSETGLRLASHVVCYIR